MIYRGYTISPVEGGYVWTDERNFIHYAEGVTKAPFATEEKAMDDIDAMRRAARAAKTEG